jgi:transcriptional regulator with XRE-family HTH domain
MQSNWAGGWNGWSLTVAAAEPPHAPGRPRLGAPENIAAMQKDLGRQLAALRREAGLTQHGLAGAAGFSRSAVSLAEIGRQQQSREFWEACDKALGTGGVLAGGADQIARVREAEQRAAALAAQEARQARAVAALAVARQRDGLEAGVTAVQPCPHCGGEVTVLTTLIPDAAVPPGAASQQR